MALIKLTYDAARELGEHLAKLQFPKGHTIDTVEIGTPTAHDVTSDEVSVYLNVGAAEIIGCNGNENTRPSEGESQ